MKAFARSQTRPQLSSKRSLATRCRSRTVQCHASVIWRQLDGTKAWVAHPRAAQVKGVIHFLGGAFAGAAPQLLYNSFVELLADAGYTTIATPYAVTFRHDHCARNVRQAFVDSIQELRTAGRNYLVPPRAPQFAVGHSNGALLHLLTSSFEQGASQGNVIISYNNLQVSDAIPIPGLLDGLQPTVQAARSIDSTIHNGNDADNSLSSSSGGRTPRGLLPALPSSQQVLAAAASSLPLLLAQEERQLLRGATLALDQLSSVVNEVGDGLTDFRPTPQESRAIVAAGYSCPATLMVQFEDDSIDQTPEMMQLLTHRLNSLSSTSSTSSSVDDMNDGGAGTRDSTSPAWSPAVTWSSMEEDMDSSSLELEWQQLQQRQQQQQQWYRSSMSRSGISSGSSALSLLNNQLGPRVQQLVLPGGHITPCGAQVQAAAVGGYKRHEAALQTLADKVLLWLDECRSRPAAPLPQVARTRQELAVLRQWASTSSQLPSPVYSPLDSLEEAPGTLVTPPMQQQEQLVTVTASRAGPASQN